MPYVLRRVLLSIPTLLIISLAVFGLSKCAPGDPIENVFGEDVSVSPDPLKKAAAYQQKAGILGIDKPVFYFSLSTAALPDTLWKIYPLDRRERLVQLAAQNGNWEATQAFESALYRTIRALESLPDSLTQKAQLRLALSSLLTEKKLESLEPDFHECAVTYQQIKPAFPLFSDSMDSLEVKTRQASRDIKSSRLFTPALHWYGLNNQYHHWLAGFLSGDWGMSKKQTPVWQELKPALFTSMSINAMAIFFAYLISIPLGVEMARQKGRRLDTWVQRVIIFLHAMPVFWMGALLIMLFCSPIFGKPLIDNAYLDVTDAWNGNRESFLHWFSSKLPKFILPVTVLTIYSLAVITMQMRGGMLETLGSDYIRTARAKGVSEDDIHWMHAFRNALFPVITIFASVFPALFTGSMVIEILFNFPGMGLKAQTAFTNHDLSVLSAILMAAAIFTILGNLVADMMYAWADPRVRFSAGK